MVNDLRQFVSKRDALFRNLTLETATAYWNATSMELQPDSTVPLATAHRARLHWLDATDEMLAESTQWLKDNGYQTTVRGGQPLTPGTRDLQRMKLGKPPLMGKRG